MDFLHCVVDGVHTEWERGVLTRRDHRGRLTEKLPVETLELVKGLDDLSHVETS